MKRYHLLAILFAFGVITVNAQFIDIMESYTVGEPISQDHWTDWDCGGGIGCAIMSTDLEARSGIKSGLITDDGTTNAVLDLGNKIFGSWGVRFYMYIPSNKEAYFNFQGIVPILDGESIVGNIYFNKDLASPGEGIIDNSALGEVTFNFPHDQWFSIIAVIDINAGINAATWVLWIDSTEVLSPSTPFTNEEGITPTSLGGINFASKNAGSNLYYLDDLQFTQGPFTGIDDFDSKGFSASPNPVNNILNISAKEDITEVTLFNILGQEIYKEEINSLSSTIDMSSFENGIYFLKVKIGDIIGTIKIIKF